MAFSWPSLSFPDIVNATYQYRVGLDPREGRRRGLAAVVRVETSHEDRCGMALKLRVPGQERPLRVVHKFESPDLMETRDLLVYVEDIILHMLWALTEPDPQASYDVVRHSANLKPT